MARFRFAILAVAVTIFFTPLIHATQKVDVTGSVFFLEGGQENYFRKGLEQSDIEDFVFSREEIAAAVAVLLGVPPPVMLSAASSAKLDSVLSPNPFKRPYAVLSLVIGGVVLESVTFEEIEGIFKSSFVKQHPVSVNGPQIAFELPGQDISLHSLNDRDYDNGLEGLEQKLRALVLFLGGSYHKQQPSELVTLKVSLPFSDAFSISIDLTKTADKKFAVELVSLFNCLELAAEEQSGSQWGQKLAKLFMGTYSALQFIDEETIHRVDATKLFLFTAGQVFRALEETFGGRMVGVYSISSITSHTSALPMFRTKESGMSRFLLDDEMAPSPSSALPNQTVYDAEVRTLIGRSIVVAVTIILLIATGLGSCFLVYMPLTRDTLLYASAKMD